MVTVRIVEVALPDGIFRRDETVTGRTVAEALGGFFEGIPGLILFRQATSRNGGFLASFGLSETDTRAFGTSRQIAAGHLVLTSPQRVGLRYIAE